MLVSFGNRILVMRMEEIEQEKNGIILPDSIDKKVVRAMVYSIPETMSNTLHLYKNQMIVVNKMSGVEIKEKGSSYWSIVPDDILATVVED